MGGKLAGRWRAARPDLSRVGAASRLPGRLRFVWRCTRAGAVCSRSAWGTAARPGPRNRRGVVSCSTVEGHDAAELLEKNAACALEGEDLGTRTHPPAAPTTL